MQRSQRAVLVRPGHHGDGVRDLDEFRDVIGGVNGPLYLEVMRGGRDAVVRVD